MKMIWATRGRNWGFRFLKDGGYSDPLIPYEAAFANQMSEPHLWLPGDDSLAVRFPDPLQRTDSSGRVISHDFVLFTPDVTRFSKFEDARRAIWEEVATTYSDLWDSIPKSE